MSPDFITRFPWYSVDASTWAKRGGFGQIPAPHEHAGNVDYLRPDYIAITELSEHDEDLHLKYLPPSQQQFVRHYLQQHVGMDLAEARGNKPSARWRCWALFLKEVERLTGIRIYFVTDTTPAQAKILNDVGVEHRLISYVRLRNKPDFLKRYCK